MDQYSIDMLKDFVDPESLLLALGFTISSSNSEEIRAPCAIHGGDNPTAFCFRRKVKRFYCFSHGCEVDFGGEVNNDVISLVMKTNSCSFSDAVDFLCNLTGFDIYDNEIDDVECAGVKKSKEKSLFVKNILGAKKLPEIDKDILFQSIVGGADYFKSIGISDEVIDKFELGSMSDIFGVDRATIPIYDDLGRLVSISGRRVVGDEEPRYRLFKDFKKGKVLYNLHRAKKYRDEFKKSVIVVEGFKALWNVFSCGFPNVVAVMGSAITREQVNLLVKHGFFYVLLMLDGDEGGKLGMERSLQRLKKKINCIPIYLPEGKSPDDLDLDSLYVLIKMFYDSFGG